VVLVKHGEVACRMDSTWTCDNSVKAETLKGGHGFDLSTWQLARGRTQLAGKDFLRVWGGE